MTKRDISAAAVPPAYFARHWPDRKRRAVAECAAGRPVAEVAAHVGVSRATVARWHRQPEFAAAAHDGAWAAYHARREAQREAEAACQFAAILAKIRRRLRRAR